MIEIQSPIQNQAIGMRISDYLGTEEKVQIELAVVEAADRFEAFDIVIELERLDRGQAAAVGQKLKFAEDYADRIDHLLIVAEDEIWRQLSAFLTWPTENLLGIPVERFSHRTDAEKWLATG